MIRSKKSSAVHSRKTRRCWLPHTLMEALASTPQWLAINSTTLKTLRWLTPSQISAGNHLGLSSLLALGPMVASSPGGLNLATGSKLFYRVKIMHSSVLIFVLWEILTPLLVNYPKSRLWTKQRTLKCRSFVKVRLVEVGTPIGYSPWNISIRIPICLCLGDGIPTSMFGMSEPKELLLCLEVHKFAVKQSMSEMTVTQSWQVRTESNKDFNFGISECSKLLLRSSGLIPKILMIILYFTQLSSAIPIKIS